MDNPPSRTSGRGKSNNRNNRKVKGKRRKQNPRNKKIGNNPTNNRNKNRPKGPPAAPQTKIVIRNIGDHKKYGTVEAVINMIRSILENTNEKFMEIAASSRASSGVARKILLDEKSARMLLEEEQAVLRAKAAAAEKAKAAQANKKNDATEANDKQQEDGNAAQEEMEPSIPEESTEQQPVEGNNAITKFSDVVTKGSNTSNVTKGAEDSTTHLLARVMYVLPPKETRRRGIKPGCAYLVISGPRIESKDLPAAVKPATGDKQRSEKALIPKTDAKLAESAPKDGEDVPALVAENSSIESRVTFLDPKPDASEAQITSTRTAPAVQPAADYSREVAKGRFLVLRAIEVLQQYTKDDAKVDQQYAGSLVEVALSGKTFKQQGQRRDRREGTLETSADYKAFCEKVAEQKEAIMSRPKPPPGGGQPSSTAELSAVAAATSVDVTADGVPIAALVAHIRSKHDEESKRNKAKKKVNKASTNKEKGAAPDKSRKKKAKDGTKEGSGKKGGRKKERKRKTKKNGTTSNKEAPPPPTLLKPGAFPGLGSPG